MRVVYIAGPLWAPTVLGRLWHIARAAREAWRWWRTGNAVICPHLNSGVYGLIWGGVERAARWLDGDLVILSRLLPGRDCVVFLRGWELSSGASVELVEAVRAGLEVRFADDAAVPRGLTLDAEGRPLVQWSGPEEVA